MSNKFVERLVAEYGRCCPPRGRPIEVTTPVFSIVTTARRAGRCLTIIYHNPRCGTSRKVLGMLRDAGQQPRIIEYLKTPPSREELVSLLARMGKIPREILQRRDTPYLELGLDDPTISDDQLIDAILAHPILLERPVVVTPRGVRLCRPADQVVDLLG